MTFNSATALSRIEQGLARWVAIDAARARFVNEKSVIFERDRLLVPESALRAAPSDEEWRRLSTGREWINASLLTTAENQFVIALLPGPRSLKSGGYEPSINVSMEQRRLLIL